MAFDFSQFFTPDRMLQGQQGVQAINSMPWVFNAYNPPAAPAMAPTQPVAPTQAVPQVDPTTAMSLYNMLLGPARFPLTDMTQSDQLALLGRG